MKNLKLLTAILKGLSKPFIRIYVRNNRLSLKLLCFIVLQIDYQLFRYLLRDIVAVVCRKSQ